MKYLHILALASTALLWGSCDTCTDCGKDDEKPNLAIPAYVTITNPYNGTWGNYINEWYYCARFAQQWPCYYDCNYIPTGYSCNGWDNQRGFFYWGQCIPPLQSGDVVRVHRYIFNTAAPSNCPSTCEADARSTAGRSTTRIIVKDANGNTTRTADKAQKQIPAGGWDIFTYDITFGQDGSYTYQVITDFFNEVDESNKTDNTSGVPGLTFQ